MQCVDLGGRRIIKKKFFQAEDGIRDFCLSRGLGDVYKRQLLFDDMDDLTPEQKPFAKKRSDFANADKLTDPVSYTHLTLPTICSV